MVPAANCSDLVSSREDRCRMTKGRGRAWQCSAARVAEVHEVWLHLVSASHPRLIALCRADDACGTFLGRGQRATFAMRLSRTKPSALVTGRRTAGLGRNGGHFASKKWVDLWPSLFPTPPTPGCSREESEMDEGEEGTRTRTRTRGGGGGGGGGGGQEEEEVVVVDEVRT